MPDDLKVKDGIKARGEPLRHTEPELDRLTSITPGSIVGARRDWAKRAPEQFKALIEAKVEEEEPQ